MSPRTPKPADDAALEGGRRRATINDIARIAGVSKKTVSRVINRSPSLRPETREKIEAVIAKYGYAPDPQARGLAFRRSFLIGLIYDNPNPQYVVNMQLGLLDGMRGSGFELVVHPCDRGSTTLVPDIRAFIERQKLFGVVLTPSVSEDEGVAAMLREIGCEYVRVASVAVDEASHSIVTQDRHGGLLAGRHLAELGHKAVGFISGPLTFRSSHERRGGLEEGLAEHGLTLAAEYVAEGAYTFESGLEGAAKLLGLPNRPTAIFAGNDEMAAGVLHAARRAGLSVPEDLSVVGFDDFQIASRVWPPLTTVRSPTREIGRLASEKLLSQAGEDKRDPADRLPSLVARESTAAPRG
ncbi:MAG: LacI family DNA-binding transcriptional regulator [Caulobacter sp.]|nr:LacI family DNA-binding transcriptional regulator [Caulobacter sp.]